MYLLTAHECSNGGVVLHSSKLSRFLVKDLEMKKSGTKLDKVCKTRQMVDQWNPLWGELARLEHHRWWGNRWLMQKEKIIAKCSIKGTNTFALYVKEWKLRRWKNYFVLSFKLKQVIPFWKGEKAPIFFQKYFFQVNNVNFGVLGQKTGTAGPTILKLFTERDQVFYKKT